MPVQANVLTKDIHRGELIFILFLPSVLLVSLLLGQKKWATEKVHGTNSRKKLFMKKITSDVKYGVGRPSSSSIYGTSSSFQLNPQTANTDSPCQLWVSKHFHFKHPETFSISLTGRFMGRIFTSEVQCTLFCHLTNVRAGKGCSSDSPQHVPHSVNWQLHISVMQSALIPMVLCKKDIR